MQNQTAIDGFQINSCAMSICLKCGLFTFRSWFPLGLGGRSPSRCCLCEGGDWEGKKRAALPLYLQCILRTIPMLICRKSHKPHSFQRKLSTSAIHQKHDELAATTDRKTLSVLRLGIILALQIPKTLLRAPISLTRTRRTLLLRLQRRRVVSISLLAIHS